MQEQDHRLRQLLGKLPPATADDWSHAVPEVTSQAAVLVPIVLGPAPFVLLTRRSTLLRHHPGQVSFPGGRADATDRDPAATALREAQEEIGLDPGSVEIMGRLPPTITYNARFSIVPVVGLLPPHAHFVASEAEVALIFGLPVSVLLDPEAPRRTTQGPRTGTWSWPHAEEDIWGATAAILVTLAQALRG